MRQLSETLHVEINPMIPGVDGRAEYRSNEFSLIYEPTTGLPEANAARSRSGAWRQNGSKVFVTAGFVTMAFHGSPFVFTSLDAYANDQRWKEMTITIPSPEERGALVVPRDQPDEERITLSTEPTFEVDHRQNVVRIRFGITEGHRYFEISRGVVVGLIDEQLSELYLSDVQFI